MDSNKILTIILLILVFVTSVILGYNIHLLRELMNQQQYNQSNVTISNQESHEAMPGFVATEINDPGHQPRYRGYLNGQLCYVYEIYNPDGSFTGCYEYVVDTDGDGLTDTEYMTTTPPI